MPPPLLPPVNVGLAAAPTGTDNCADDSRKKEKSKQKIEDDSGRDSGGDDGDSAVDDEQHEKEERAIKQIKRAKSEKTKTRGPATPPRLTNRRLRRRRGLPATVEIFLRHFIVIVVVVVVVVVVKESGEQDTWRSLVASRWPPAAD